MNSHIAARHLPKYIVLKVIKAMRETIAKPMPNIAPVELGIRAKIIYAAPITSINRRKYNNFELSRESGAIVIPARLLNHMVRVSNLNPTQ